VQVTVESFRRVGALSALPDGKMLSVRAADNAEVVVVNVGGRLYAMGSICSHEEAWLDSGWLHAESLELECPLHEARFDLRSGQPTCLPAERPVKTYELRIEGDDILLGPARDGAA
jgi:nitrite reductase/ring-hydroxylating ferredoxin subunit